MGVVLYGIIAAILAQPSYAWSQPYLIPCYGHNTTKLTSVHTLLNETDITLYDDACWAGIQVGVVKGISEIVNVKSAAIDDAFNTIAFASCLARAIHFSHQNISTQLVVNQSHIYLQVNITRTPYTEGFPKPWFIHPGALRWATVFCGILAVIRALYG
ncbi:ORF4' protein [Kafue kinda chacma baboon virus]|uniref:ORF4' protein n=1 Tax=Kafue kinda chacma baboon virus TaxID=1823757 RepID=A0A109QKZ5_9NIDO|nr:ORF4' protein [Kafue kinda chacma baboon virus]AMB20713.1 ORF4' protein [Kafue kinda chacma baboon virus]AMV49336.1 ORF4' protein [Kafue kinda chacma baboon virus]